MMEKINSRSFVEFVAHKIEDADEVRFVRINADYFSLL